MSTTGAQVIASVRRILLDPDADWFTDADLIDFINTAQVKVVAARPELNPTVETLPLVTGTVQQIGGTNGVALLDIYHNLVSGIVATQPPRSVLDNGSPTWPGEPAAVDAIHWIHDQRVKTMFRVYPPNNGNGQVVALVSRVPTRLTAAASLLTVSDLYKPVIDAFTLAEAYSANTVKRDVEKASFYENKAMTMLGLNGQTGAALAPKFSAPGGS